MNFLKNLIGITEKEQKAKTEVISAYVDKKKDSFKKEMKDLKKQAKSLKNKYAKLGLLVDDVAYKVDKIVSGEKYAK